MTYYLRSYDKSVDLDLAYSVLPVTILVGTFLLPIGAYLAQRMHPKLGILLGASIGISTTFLSSFAKNFWLFLFLYGVMYGIASSVLYIIPIVTGWAFFPHRKGMVSGIVIAGFSFGSFVFNLVTTAIVNPDNKEPTEGKEVCVWTSIYRGGLRARPTNDEISSSILGHTLRTRNAPYFQNIEAPP